MNDRENTEKQELIDIIEDDFSQPRVDLIGRIKVPPRRRALHMTDGSRNRRHPCGHPQPRAGGGRRRVEVDHRRRPRPGGPGARGVERGREDHSSDPGPRQEHPPDSRRPTVAGQVVLKDRPTAPMGEAMMAEIARYPMPPQDTIEVRSSRRSATPTTRARRSRRCSLGTSPGSSRGSDARRQPRASRGAPQ